MDPDHPLRKRIGELSRRDQATLFLCIITLPLAIALLQALLFLVIIPAEIPPDLVWLSYGNPTVSGMFLSSYFHSITDLRHLYANYAATLIVMTLIAVMFVIVMPAYGITIPRRFVNRSFLSFFLVLPFWIAAVSLYFHPVFPEARWAVGFSGIVAALLGFAFLLILRVTYTVMLRNRCAGRETVFTLIVGALFIAIVPSWIMLSEIGGTVNVFAHIAGYSFGLLVPALLGLRE
ncbi:MAG: rhomboid family intramembrane serine protease [Methanomicrobiaceae archaeon]|nr:rhomboid family intramembrane serine protease [Methanomicrobiaceae archaeon]